MTHLREPEAVGDALARAVDEVGVGAVLSRKLLSADVHQQPITSHDEM